MMESMHLVKRCPACGRESDASALRCGCGALLAHVDLTAPRGAQAAAAGAPPSDPSPDALACPHADCAQPNAHDALRCVYCDRPMNALAAIGARRMNEGGGPSADTRAAARIEWPWGASMSLMEELIIGRAPPADAGLAARLARDFDNVSRRHAVLRISSAGVTIEDLGSSNGTFVNGVRLAANQPVPLHDGARLQFAADLVATLRLTND